MPTSVEQCRRYGAKVAQRFRDLPNIVWMTGGDYVPATDDPAVGSDVDHCLDAMMRGIRESGDGRPFSIQLGARKSLSTDNPYWAPRVDWNFVYTYYPTYKAVLDAHRRQPPVPAVLGEANYEGENNQPETPPTTDEPMDVLENDYVTAARAPDGRLAVVYLPARRTISVDPAVMAAGTRAVWIDPTSGVRRPVAHVGQLHHAGPERRRRP